jgi:K+-transporting ATPase ATPase C chain
MLAQFRPALILLLVFTVITGALYPLAVTGVAQVGFHVKANGSLIEKDGIVIGSELIGQPFTDPKYFWPRPSATGPNPYQADASSGSNLGPLNPALIEAVEERVATLEESDPDNEALVPIDLVTASGSGLDPHISVASALYQVSRVASARGLDEAAVRGLVDRHVEDRQLWVLGEPRVNVLELNLALDSLE